MKVRVVPYKKGSASARELATALSELLGYKVWRGPAKAKRHNINWGNVEGDFPVGKAVNKLTAFKVMLEAGVSIPWFTSNKEEAQHKAANGMDILCRQKLDGHSGDGIEDFIGQDAPLYVAYVKKKAEFRVHVFNGKVLDVQEKRRRKVEEGQPEANPRVRNLANGWVFCRENVTPDQKVLDEAIKAVAALGMVFGAADVIWNEFQKTAYVLEVNSAPGLCETSAKLYAAAFKEYFNA